MRNLSAKLLISAAFCLLLWPNIGHAQGIGDPLPPRPPAPQPPAPVPPIPEYHEERPQPGRRPRGQQGQPGPQQPPAPQPPAPQRRPGRNGLMHDSLGLSDEQRGRFPDLTEEQRRQRQGQGSRSEGRYTKGPKGPCKRDGKGCSTGPRRQTPGGRTGKPSSKSGRVRAIGARAGAIAGVAILAPYARNILDAIKEAKDNPDLPAVIVGLATIVSDFDDALGRAQRAIGGPPVPGVAKNQLQLASICLFKFGLTEEDAGRSKANEACYERDNPTEKKEVLDTPDLRATRRDEINEILSQCQAFDEHNQQAQNACDEFEKELQDLNWVTDADKVIPNNQWSGGCRCRQDKSDCPLRSLRDCTKGWPRTEEEQETAEDAEKEEKAYWAKVVAGLGVGRASNATKAEGEEPRESGVPGPPGHRPTESAIAEKGPPGLSKGPTLDSSDADDNVQSIALGKNKDGFCELDTDDVYDPKEKKYLVKGTNKFVSKPNRWEPENVDSKCA